MTAARSKGIRLAPGLTLPLDAATESFGVMGQRGSGKSNTEVVMAEEMFDAGIPWVAVDPKGDWHGIRSNVDGTKPGLPIPVFGGLHGDVPLEAGAGNLVADLLVDENITAVLDVSRFTGDELSRFLVDFCHRLFRRHQEEPHVRHVFYEEAHRYIPQQVSGATAAMKEACAKIPLEGRSFGLGSSSATQRPARLHKDVTTQFGTLIVGRVMAKQDRDAIGGWFEEQSVGKEALSTLQNLTPGEMWVLSPLTGVFERVTVRRRRTFDTGATPKVGQARRRPATLADIDTAAIKDAMAATIEKAKADDPKELRRTIAELRRQLAARPTEKVVETVVETVVERVEVPVLDEQLVVRLEEALSPAAAVLSEVQDRLGWEVRQRDEVFEFERRLRDDRQDVPGAGRAGRGARPVAGHAARAGAGGGDVVAAPAQAGRAPQRADPPRRRDPRVPAVPGAAPGELSGPQQRVLDAIAWLNDVGFPRPSKLQTGFIAGYRVGKKVGGTYGNLLGQLRAQDLIAYPTQGQVELTDTGRSMATPADIEPTTAGLQAAVLGRLDGPERRVLTVLIDAYPDSLSKQETGERAGYTVGAKVGGTFGNILGRLRSLGIVDYPRPGEAVAGDVLFIEGGQ